MRNKNNYIPNERKEKTPFGEFDLTTRKISKRRPNNNNGREGSIEKYSGEGTFKGNLKKENISRKQVVRLTESQLHNIISESVRQVLRESETFEDETLFENGVFDIYNHRYGGPAYLVWRDGVFRIPENYSYPNLRTRKGRNEMLTRVENGELEKERGDFSTLLTKLGEKGYRETSFNANAW